MSSSHPNEHCAPTELITVSWMAPINIAPLCGSGPNAHFAFQRVG